MNRCKKDERDFYGDERAEDESAENGSTRREDGTSFFLLLINVHRLRQRSELSDSSTTVQRRKKIFFEKFEIQIREEIIFFSETNRQDETVVQRGCLSSRDFTSLPCFNTCWRENFFCSVPRNYDKKLLRHVLSGRYKHVVGALSVHRFIALNNSKLPFWLFFARSQDVCYRGC